jgi:hypothetical protein
MIDDKAKPFAGREHAGMEEAIRYVMKVTGKTRRQARQALLEKFKSGEIRSFTVNPATGEPEPVPVEAWGWVATEH